MPDTLMPIPAAPGAADPTIDPAVTRGADLRRAESEADRAYQYLQDAIREVETHYPRPPAIVLHWFDWQVRFEGEALTRPLTNYKERLELSLTQIREGEGSDTDQYKRFAVVLTAWNQWEAECKAIDRAHGVDDLLGKVEKADETIDALTDAFLDATPTTLRGFAMQLNCVVMPDLGVKQTPLMRLVRRVIAEYAKDGEPLPMAAE